MDPNAIMLPTTHYPLPTMLPTTAQPALYMIISNQKGVDIELLRASNTCTREKVRFQNGCEDSIRVDRSEMTREGKRMASMSNTTRGKSNVDTMFGEEIEGGRVKLTRWSVRM